MNRIVCGILLLWTAVAFGKSWLGIDPGVSSRDDVVKQFGEPSKSLTRDGKELIGYFGPKAIKGTKQVQFRIDPASKLVERIDIFPAADFKRADFVKKYGPECPPGVLPEEPCFVQKTGDDKKTYLHYVRIGLAVFLKADGETVQSMVFTPTKS